MEHLTLQTILGKKFNLSMRQSTIPQNSGASKTVCTEVFENEANGKVISGKWVLKPHKARYVLRGFEEDVKDEDVFASTKMTASV